MLIMVESELDPLEDDRDLVDLVDRMDCLTALLNDCLIGETTGTGFSASSSEDDDDADLD